MILKYFERNPLIQIDVVGLFSMTSLWWMVSILYIIIVNFNIISPWPYCHIMDGDNEWSNTFGVKLCYQVTSILNFIYKTNSFLFATVSKTLIAVELQIWVFHKFPLFSFIKKEMSFTFILSKNGFFHIYNCSL